MATRTEFKGIKQKINDHLTLENTVNAHMLNIGRGNSPFGKHTLRR